MAKENNAEIWTLENNNVCFRYEKRKYHQDIWLIIIPLIICVIITLTEFIRWGTFVSVLPCVIFLFLMALYWLSRTEEKNENTEKEIIWNILCDKIKSDVVKYGENIKIVRYKYQIDSKGTYGIVTGQRLVVLLSDDKVLEYKVEYHRPEGEIPLYYEVFSEPTESTNPEHLKAIQKRKNYIKKLSEKNQLTMLILVIIIFGLGIFSLGFYLGETYKWNLLIFVAVYLVLYSTISHFTKNRENKIAKTLNLVVEIPFTIVYFALNCTIPALSIIMGFMFTALIALSIPLFIMIAIDFFYR